MQLCIGTVRISHSSPRQTAQQNQRVKLDPASESFVVVGFTDHILTEFLTHVYTCTVYRSMDSESGPEAFIVQSRLPGLDNCLIRQFVPYLLRHVAASRSGSMGSQYVSKSTYN